MITEDRSADELARELGALGLDVDTEPTLEEWREFVRRIGPRLREVPLSLRDLHHRVRTPLTVVLGASELLLESELDSEQRKAVLSLHRSGRQVLEELDRMLSDGPPRPKSWPPRMVTPVGIPQVEVPKLQHRILLAEDDEFNRVLIERALLPLHCELDYAANGREVLAQFAPGKYALVLMDCEMPEMDGIEAAREIRKREQDGAHVPIIAVTAMAGTGASRHCFDAGMDDFLAKPFSVGSLRRKVMHWLFVGNQAKERASLAASSAGPRALRPKRTNNDVLDMSRLDELAREAGSPQIVVDLSHIFAEDLARRLESIRDALSARDDRAFGALAHSIKGACSNFGAMRMAQLGEELERKSRVGDYRDAESTIAKLSEEFRAVRQILDAEVFAEPKRAAQFG